MNRTWGVLLVAGAIFEAAGAAKRASPPRRLPVLRLSTGTAAIAIGRSLRVTARAVRDGRPASGVEVVPFVDGRQWGAPAKTDARGHAEWLLPLPRAGIARVQAVVRPAAMTDAFWIWSPKTADGQTVYFRRAFRLRGSPRRAELRITCDDSFQAFLNGHPIAHGSNFQQSEHVTGLERLLKPGMNLLAVEGRNAVGPAGLVARLEADTDRDAEIIPTNGLWERFDAQPAGWPASSTGRGAPVHVEAQIGAGVWGRSVRGWPGFSPGDTFPVGRPIPAGAIVSNTARIRVVRRTIHRTEDPSHLVGMEWEPWFTSRNSRWETAEAVPLVGEYDSYNRDVIRQHALWMADAGIDFLLVDWSNNLWRKKHWVERDPGIDELVRATGITIDTYAAMRREGIPVPKIVLLLGLDNGPQTTTTALNEEMRWFHDRYVADPRYRGLWVEYEGKPLIVIFNGGGPAIRSHQPPIATSLFTVRWMASQLQVSHLERQGYWSWMDGVIHPIPTFHKGSCEALTVTPAFFGDGGWTARQARGRRGGATYREEFKTAIQYRPRFLLINQWNEFTGQPDGGGYGPKHDQYVDCYSAELSDDVEPTALDSRGYRGDRGWGFYYLHLTRSLLDRYRRRPRSGLEVSSGGLPPRRSMK